MSKSNKSINNIKLREKVKKTVKKGFKNISKKDLNKVLEKQEKIEKKFNKKDPLGKFISDLYLLFSIIKDYINGKYKVIPWKSVAVIAFALLYVLNPFDIIPDVIPVIGYLDDAAVVAFCLKMVENDLDQYAEWKKSHSG